MLVATVLLVAGAASSAQTDAASVLSPATLKERVEQRWQTLIEGDFSATYQFQTPAYREIYSVNQFRANFGNQARWLSAQVENVSLPTEQKEQHDAQNPLSAEVEVQLEYQVPFPPDSPVRTSKIVKETWLLVDDQWWYGG